MQTGDSYNTQDGELSELAEDSDEARIQKRRRLDRPPPAALERYAKFPRHCSRDPSHMTADSI